MVELLIGDDHRDMAERARPTAAGAGEGPEHAGEVLVSIVLGPGGEHVEHAADPAGLAGMGQVDPHALEARVGLEQPLERLEVDLEHAARQARRGASRHRGDVGPQELESHVRSVSFDSQHRGFGVSPVRSKG